MFYFYHCGRAENSPVRISLLFVLFLIQLPLSCQCEGLLPGNFFRILLYTLCTFGGSFSFNFSLVLLFSAVLLRLSSGFCKSNGLLTSDFFRILLYILCTVSGRFSFNFSLVLLFFAVLLSLSSGFGKSKRLLTCDFFRILLYSLRTVGGRFSFNISPILLLIAAFSLADCAAGVLLSFCWFLSCWARFIAS